MSFLFFSKVFFASSGIMVVYSILTKKSNNDHPQSPTGTQLTNKQLIILDFSIGLALYGLHCATLK